MNDIAYGFAAAGDLVAIRALLADCGLPGEDLEQVAGHCIAAKLGSEVVGSVALEPYGRSGLLRSLAVAPAWRGRSLGCTLYSKMVVHARLLGVEELYLLTTDAERYFAGLGFRRIERGEAPGEIQATSQFRSLCPKSAVCMRREIGSFGLTASHETV
jgi:amino-acid N-acetyltransferase